MMKPVYCPPNVDCPCYVALTKEVDRLTAALNVERIVSRGHQAMIDSLLRDNEGLQTKLARWEAIDKKCHNYCGLGGRS